jgi:hypothetical protein
MNIRQLSPLQRDSIAKQDSEKLDQLVSELFGSRGSQAMGRTYIRIGQLFISIGLRYLGEAVHGPEPPKTFHIPSRR